MKKFFLFSMIYFLAVNAYCQQVFKDKNCETITSYLAGRNDTLVIQCDSVYLLNKKTFAIYQTAYDKWKGRDVNVRQVFNTYENLVELQARRIDQQELEYTRLKAQFDSLAFSSSRFIDKTSNRLGEVNDALNKVNKNLDAALVQINDSKSLIKEEKKKRIKNSIAFGAGGLTLGLLIGLVLN